MPRKKRFALVMRNGAEVRTIEELRDSFDLEAALSYYDKGKLLTWLTDRYYTAEAEEIRTLDGTANDFNKRFCEILHVECDENFISDDEQLIKNRLARLTKITDDKNWLEKVDSIALDQDDLLDILDSGKQEIYLCNGRFEIPLGVSNVTYKGIFNPVVIIYAADNVDFAKLNIKLVDIVFGWDVSRVTKNDKTCQAEHFFMKGEYQKAKELLEETVESKNPHAMTLLLQIYRDFECSAEQKDKLVQELKNIGDSFGYIESEQMTETMESILCMLTKRPDPVAEFYFGWYFNKIANNNEKAIEWLTKSAESGFSRAQNSLGLRYDNGAGVIKDKEKAIEWYTKASLLGNAIAQCNLGCCYRNGNGVAEDREKAAEWFTKSALQGYAAAQYNLGNCYRSGSGVSEDKGKAAEWYTKAAMQENAAAQCNLAYCYKNGIGVAQDKGKAVEWYTKAAQQGNAVAQYNLGFCYESGDGLFMDKGKAVEWYTKAASKDYECAQYSLGLCFEYGKGVPMDKKKAAEWYQKAADKNYEPAINSLKKLGISDEKAS